MKASCLALTSIVYSIGEQIICFVLFCFFFFSSFLEKIWRFAFVEEAILWLKSYKKLVRHLEYPTDIERPLCSGRLVLLLLGAQHAVHTSYILDSDGNRLLSFRFNRLHSDANDVITHNLAFKNAHRFKVSDSSLLILCTGRCRHSGKKRWKQGNDRSNCKINRNHLFLVREHLRCHYVFLSFQSARGALVSLVVRNCYQTTYWLFRRDVASWLDQSRF